MTASSSESRPGAHASMDLARPLDTELSQLEDFSEVIAHELRTPLAVVTTASETLLARVGSLESHEVERLVQVINRNSRLASLLLNRLDLARDIEEDSVVLSVEDVDLAQLVRDSVSDLADVVLHGHATTVSTPEQISVTADPTALREIVFNLLANAAKYSHDGAAIDVVVSGVSPGAEVVVRDHGPGVAPADSDLIFEQYVQGDPGSSGVGLGLYISRGLARAHGGDLSVRPTADEGTEFVLALPADGAAARHTAADGAEQASAAAVLSDSAAGRSRDA